MKIITSILITLFLVLAFGEAFGAEDQIVFDFEETTENWKVPDWAFYQNDHKAQEVETSDKYASSGERSLKLMCEFPGDVWTAALVERKGDMDLSEYDTISVDIYLPKKGPRGLIEARIILTVGEGWRFTEMRSAVPLRRGKWVTVKVNLDKGEEGITEWRGRGEKRLFLNIDKIRKIAVRIEYNAAPPHRIGPRYRGPIFIDNLVIE